MTGRINSLRRRYWRSLTGRPPCASMVANAPEPREPRSPMQMYLDGGGDLPNPRVDDEAPTIRRSSTDADPQDATLLHAHEITPNDAAMIRMMAGAHFGLDATVTLPSGRTITGAEMQQWIEAND